MECKIFRLKRIRAQVRRLLPLLFLLFSLLIMVLLRSDNPVLVRMRFFMWNCFVPVVSIIRQPVYWVKNGANNIKDWVFTYHENENLKQENEDLKQWRFRALKLEAENEELKKHLNFSSMKKKREISAEIVLDEGGAFNRSFVVMAGKKQGVLKGMLAFGPNGLFGRIVKVSDNYAHLMPLTDYMSRVPVFVGKNKIPAFLVGDNTDMPYLQFPDEDSLVQKGDIVMSSGYMGVYPSNLPIGRVHSKNDDTPKVTLFEDINILSFVRLLDFGLTENILKSDERKP